MVYLTFLICFTNSKCSDENFDVLRAQKILDEDHYGLNDVKERILEFIAVGKLRGTSQGLQTFFSVDVYEKCSRIIDVNKFSSQFYNSSAMKL